MTTTIKIAILIFREIPWRPPPDDNISEVSCRR